MEILELSFKMKRIWVRVVDCLQRLYNTQGLREKRTISETSQLNVVSNGTELITTLGAELLG